MALTRLGPVLAAELDELAARGTLKGEEPIVEAVVAAREGRGPRVRLRGEGEREFLRMNSNSYLGLSARPELLGAAEAAARRYGAGPGAVRFISGTCVPHVDLEARLAAFHGREAGMLFSSAYAAVLGVLTSLVTPDTLVLSDDLNHNCIIQATRLSRPGDRQVYRHLDVADLDARLRQAAGGPRRAVVVTDGVFSMRGDHAPLADIAAVAREHDGRFPENVVLVVDDSHGVGACGATGRGTEELTAASGVDVLVATLGKAFGVNGGYAVAARQVVAYMRQKAATYIYSNPITPAEAAAARAALDILDGPEGASLLAHLRAMTGRFRDGLAGLGLESLPGEHPVVPLMVRDTARTAALVAHLRRHDILATGLAFPVVPRGDEEIRFQISASHTPADIDRTLEALGDFGA